MMPVDVGYIGGI